jgi:hypothetical protein
MRQLEEEAAGLFGPVVESLAQIVEKCAATDNLSVGSGR